MRSGIAATDEAIRTCAWETVKESAWHRVAPNAGAPRPGEVSGVGYRPRARGAARLSALAHSGADAAPIGREGVENVT